jgi:hypothetical protein
MEGTPRSQGTFNEIGGTATRIRTPRGFELVSKNDSIVRPKHTQPNPMGCKKKSIVFDERPRCSIVTGNKKKPGELPEGIESFKDFYLFEQIEIALKESSDETYIKVSWI